MSSLTHRAAGAVGATLDGNRARPGIIADGVHVHEVALHVAYRRKGADGIAPVTDAMEAAGLPPGEYELSGRDVRLQETERFASPTVPSRAARLPWTGPCETPSRCSAYPRKPPPAW